MGSYRIIDPVALLTAGVMSGTSTLKSIRLDIAHLTCAAFQITWTGNPTGALTIEASLDGQAYTALPASGSSPSGSAGSTVINLTGMAVRFLRASYTNVSGAGALTVLGAAKGI